MQQLVLGQSLNDMDLIYLGQIAAALVAILTLLGMLVKWAIVKPIKAYIETMTYAIQPYANGGKSLPDLIKKVDALHVVVQNHLTTSHDTPISSKCLCKSDWHA
jgi:xanthosine utilization system XapX-like protein